MRGSSLPLKRSTARRMSASGPRRGRALAAPSATVAGCASARASAGAVVAARCRLARRLRRGAPAGVAPAEPLARVGGRLRLSRLPDGGFHRSAPPGALARSSVPATPRARGACAAHRQAAPGLAAACLVATGLLGRDPAGRLGARAAQDADAVALACGVTYSWTLLALEDRAPADGAGREGVGCSGTRPNVATRIQRRRAAACRGLRP